MWGITDAPLEIGTEEFLSAFYGPSETVYFRTYNDKDKTKEGRKLAVDMYKLQSILPMLQKLNSEDNAISFIVNGGGQTKKEVRKAGRCRSQFMECDDLTIHEQLEQINNFPLEPSIVVKTRKSLHTYWLLENGDIRYFSEIQKALAAYFNGDSNISDESRPMRLPGFNHCKAEPVMVRVIHWRPDLKYTQEQLVKVLPKPEKKKQAKKKAAGGKAIQEGSRVSSLISLIGSLKHSELSDEAIKSAIRAENESRCNPPLTEEELEGQVFPAVSRFQSEPVPSRAFNTELVGKVSALEPEKRYKWSDIGNSELFADVFSDRVRWNTTANQWYQYDGRIWTLDAGGMIANGCAQQLQKALLVYSSSIDDLEIRDKYVKYVLQLGHNGSRKKMLEDAKVHKFISADDLDVDPMILNVQNGVLDLRKKTFKEGHSPDQMLSRICNVEYKPEAKGERWIRFMEEVMEGDQEKISFLQRAFGYSLTGETKEETCFILYGKSTRNGKSTAMETIKYLLGGDKGYSLAMLPETLARKDRKDSSRASGDIARLNHCRFLNMSEPDKGMIFDTALLKTMLGRDSITARHLFEREFEFIPQFKLFVNTNHLPVIKDTSLFSSGRVNVVEFNRHFETEEQDKDLKDKLREPEELSGVLNWMLKGLTQYKERGLDPPKCVRDATEEYRSISDKIGNFFDDCMERMEGHNVAGSAAYTAYDLWCSDNGYGCENKGNFFADLRPRNLLAPSGTVDGKTVRNVIRNYHLLTFNKNRGTGNDNDGNPFE